MELGLQQPGRTCDDCRWKVERRECPWNFLYEGTNYAEDCDDFRNVRFPEDAFNKEGVDENDSETDQEIQETTS